MIKRNTPFELVLLSIGIPLILFGQFVQDLHSPVYLVIGYALTGIVLLSKTLRIKELTPSLKVTWIACVAVIFVVAGMTLKSETSNWGGLWVAAVCVFAVTSKNVFDRKTSGS